MGFTDDSIRHRQAIWHLNRQSAGLEGDGYDGELVESVIGERVSTRAEATAVLAERPGLLAGEHGIDIHGPMPTLDGNAPDIPPLPDVARWDSTIGTGAGAWLDAYVEYADAISPMTPRNFHTAAGLWLAAVAIARRLRVPMLFGNVFPNIFVIWLAPTTLFRKTTGLGVAQRMARRTFPHLLAAPDTTPEALVSELAGQEPVNLEELPEEDQESWRRGRDHSGQRGWILDEMSSLLARAGRKYGTGLIEELLSFYDCTDHYRRRTQSKGITNVRASYLSLLGASTPTAMQKHLLDDGLWNCGWWPRFALLTPERERPVWQRPRESTGASDLERDMLRLYEALPKPTWPDPPTARKVSLGPGVYETWSVYNKALAYDLLTPDLDRRLYGTYGRLPMQALKVAVILAALDWRSGTAPVIELPHMARALDITEGWRAGDHRALASAAVSDTARMEDRVIRQVARHEPRGASLRDVYRGMRDREPDDVASSLERLVRFGQLDVERNVGSPRGGPRTDRYHLPG